MVKYSACAALLTAALVGCAQPGRSAEDRWAPVLTRTMLLEGVRNTRPDVGVPGRIDHFAYDPATGRLFVAALENGSLEVLDLEKGERVRSIPGLPLAQGVAVIPSGACVAVASGGDGRLHVFDTRTLEEKRVVDVGPDADNVRYDAQANAICVCYGEADKGAVAVFDAGTWRKLREIPFSSKPESFQLDPAGRELFANLPGGVKAVRDGLVEVVNRDTGRTEAEVPLKGLARNFPMAFDAAHGRLFVACRKPARLIVIDTRRNTVIAQAPCSEDSDDLYYDAETGHVLVIGGGFRPDLPDTVAPGQSPLPSEMGAIDVSRPAPTES